MEVSNKNRLTHNLIEGWVLNRVDRVVVQTISIGNSICKLYSVSRDKVVHVYAGLDIEYLDSLKLRRDEQGNTILYPAVITKRKNQIVLIRALSEIVKDIPGCKLLLVGKKEDVEYYEYLKSMIEEYGLVENVEWIGHLKQRELYELYNQASLVAFPSKSETFGLIAIEAMYFKVPVVASNIIPMKDIYNRGMRLCETDDYIQWYNIIYKILQDKRLCSIMGVAGNRTVRKIFDWKVLAKKMISIYTEVCYENNI